MGTLICAALDTQLFAIKSASRIQTRFGLGKGGWEFPPRISSGSLKRSVTRFQRLPKKSNLKERLQTRFMRIVKRPLLDVSLRVVRWLKATKNAIFPWISPVWRAWF